MRMFVRSISHQILIFFFSVLLSWTLLIPQTKVWAEECSTLIPLYQNSLEQLAQGEKIFLTQGCSDDPESTKCKKVAMAIREMQGSVTMFSLRLKALQCHPEYSKPKTPCQRLQSMKDKIDQKLNLIQSQLKSKMCSHSSLLPQCTQLKTEKTKQLGILRALHIKIKKEQCSDKRTETK